MDINEVKAYSSEELSKMVHVQADATTRWNGVDYDLTNGVDVMFGVVVAWKKTHKSVDFNVSDVSETPKSKREIQNPLEENGRGASFEGLVRRKPRG